MSDVHRFHNERRRNIAVIGVASGIGAADPGCGDGPGVLEAGEDALLRGSGVRVFFMDEVAQRGLDAVMQEALAIVQCGTAGFGLSVDMDAIDPKDAPAVSTPAPAGLHAPELMSALARLRNHPGLLALEIAEFDPYRDEDGKTAAIVSDLLTAVLGRGDAVPESMIALELHHGAHTRKFARGAARSCTAARPCPAPAISCSRLSCGPTTTGTWCSAKPSRPSSTS
jgi:hypothetical protein